MSGIQLALQLAQALGIPFNMMSCSEPKPSCRAFLAANVRTQPTHWHATMEDQIKSAPCTLHRHSINGCNAKPAGADVSVAGTPCHPFSTQLAGRYSKGKVQEHQEYEIAMKLFLQWMRTFEPAFTVFEQVPGFTKPMEAGGTETAYDRPVRFCPQITKLMSQGSSSSIVK